LLKVKKLPSFDDLMLPLIEALNALGGSGSIEEIYTKVVEQTGFTDDVLAQLHDAEKSSLTEVGYRLAWARTYLKKYGYLENSSRGIWALTDKARASKTFNQKDVVNFVRALDKPQASKSLDTQDSSGLELVEEQGWKEKLSAVLTQKLDPSAFERLVQRLLRESGFIQVEVTGRTGDAALMVKVLQKSMDL
jgi:restriction system protein